MPCVRGLAVRRDDQPGTGCHRGCLHRQTVEGYRLAWDAWWARREEWAAGYATENDEYEERTGDRQPLFKDWLTQHARSHRT